jgi:hypothetical protein
MFVCCARIWRHRSNGGDGVLSCRHNGLVSCNDHECTVMNHLKSIRNISDHDALQYTWLLLWNCLSSWVSLSTDSLAPNPFPPLDIKSGPFEKCTLNHGTFEPAASIMIEVIVSLKVERAVSSKTLVLAYQNTCHHVLGDCSHYSNMRISITVHQNRYSLHSLYCYWLQYSLGYEQKE